MRILMLGNSFTFANDMPAMLAELTGAEVVHHTRGRVVQKGVYAKMARDEMVRFMAGIHAEDPEQIKTFDWSGYHFDEDRSSTDEYVFIRTEIPGKPSRR